MEKKKTDKDKILFERVCKILNVKLQQIPFRFGDQEIQDCWSLVSCIDEDEVVSGPWGVDNRFSCLERNALSVLLLDKFSEFPELCGISSREELELVLTARGE